MAATHTVKLGPAYSLVVPISGNLSILGTLSAFSSSLTLSSSANSIVSISSSLDFPNSDKQYHVRAVNSHLILSSSAGSRIVISGSLIINGITSYTNKSVIELTSSVHSHALILSLRGSPVGIGQNIAGGVNTLELTTNDVSLVNQASRIVIRGGTNEADVEINSGQSGSITNYVLFDGANRAIDLLNAVSGGYHIRSTDSHLILSSSVGSAVRVSSSLGLHKATSTAMPAGSDNLSGSIVWVDNVKQFAIYGPLGWTRITTGSVIG